MTDTSRTFVDIFHWIFERKNKVPTSNRCQSSWCARLFRRRVFYCKVLHSGRDQSGSRHYRYCVHDEKKTKKRVDVVGSTHPKYNNYRFPLSVYVTGQIGRWRACSYRGKNTRLIRRYRGLSVRFFFVVCVLVCNYIRFILNVAADD